MAAYRSFFHMIHIRAQNRKIIFCANNIRPEMLLEHRLH